MSDLVLPSMSKEALDNLPFGAYVINPEGVIEFFNKEMARISGVENPNDIEGQNVLEIPTYKKFGLDKYIMVGLKGSPFKVEAMRYVSYVGKKESFRSYWGIPVKDKAGKMLKLLCIVEDVTDKIRAQQQVQGSLKEKEALLEEVNHRVKNNMQVVYSLLNIQSNKIKDPEALELITESKNQIKSMLTIHEHLYQSRDLSGIDLKKYISELVDNLYQVYNIDPARISADLDINCPPLSVDKAIPCSLIVNELVSNSFRHGFDGNEKGRISIKIYKKGINYEMEISDNGRGFPEEPDLNKPDSLGLELVNTLTRQLNGQVNIFNAKGVKARVSFPETTTIQDDK